MSCVEGTRARRSDRARVHRAFGLGFACSFDLPGVPDAAGSADVELALADPGDLSQGWSGAATPPAATELVLDGQRYLAERGAAGDHRFVYGNRASFHLSADRRLLRCAPEDADAPEWRRVLLDSVLATVALLHGYEALHAASVLGDDGVVAIMGRTGGGKTTLAAELLTRGRRLVSDDILMLSREDSGEVVGHPAPPLMNLPASSPAPPGTTLAAIAGEQWVSVDGAATSAAPVTAVCLVDRRPGSRAAVVPGRASPLDLLTHGLKSGDAPERRAARFELLTDLAAQAPAYVLEADPRTPAAELTDLLESAVPALAHAETEAAR